jgi:ribosome-binding factor A
LKKGPTQRQLRVGEQVRHALSDLLQRGAIDDEILQRTVISVSEVRMSPDLRLATAYVAPLGASEDHPVADALNRHARFIRGRLGPQLRQLKYMPEIRFRLDTSFDNLEKIDRLLRSPAVARDLAEKDDTD